MRVVVSNAQPGAQYFVKWSERSSHSVLAGNAHCKALRSSREG